MKKIFLMFILTFNFLNAEIIKNLSVLKLSNNITPFCVSSYNLLDELNDAISILFGLFIVSIFSQIIP